MSDKLRPASPTDAAVMSVINRAAFPVKESWSHDVILMQLEMPGVFGFVHADGGMILARVAADEADILTVAVVPEQQRRGIGTVLLRAAMTEAAAQGAAAMFLEVAVTNTAARALYVEHGFAEAGRRRRYYSDGTDALVMRCALRP